MRWAHLPVEGGIYAQHPKLIEQFSKLFDEKAKHEEAEAERQKRESKSGSRR
jgi:hypothetical protein